MSGLCRAVAGGVAWVVCAWLAVADSAVPELVYEGGDEHVFARLEGSAEVGPGVRVSVASDWVFTLVVEAESGVTVGGVAGDLLLGPSVLVGSVRGPEREAVAGGGERLTWVMSGTPGVVGVFDLGEPVVGYSLVEGGGGEVVLADVGVGLGFAGALEVLAGEEVLASSEASGARGVVGGRWWSVWLWGVVLGVAGLCVAVVLVRLLVRLVRFTVAYGALRGLAPPLPGSAQERALARLDALEEAGHLARGEFGVVASGACDVARWYIGARFGLRAPRMTTREFLGEAGRSRVIGGRAGKLRGLLERADRIKFAGDGATLEDAERALASVRAFVYETGERDGWIGGGGDALDDGVGDGVVGGGMSGRAPA